MSDRIQYRYDTKANWEKFNPVLLKGEVGYEEDGEQYKVGDGVRPWKELPYRGLPCLDQPGDDRLTPMSQDAVTKEIKKLVQKRAILNVSQETGNYKFADREAARLAVPEEHRGVAQILVYQTVERLVIEYCIVTNINDDAVWTADSSWKAVGSGGALNISEEKDNYAFATAGEARNAVQVSDRKRGQMICYCQKDTGWVYERFTGTDSSNWTDSSLWEYFATDKHLKALSGYLSQAVTDFDTTLRNKLRELDTYLSGKLSEFETGLSKKADGYRITDENKLQLTSEGRDTGEAIDLPSGIVNLSAKDNRTFASAEDAHHAVKKSDRILGQLITYKLADGGEWVLDHFVGESTGSWENGGSWKQVAYTASLAPVFDVLDTLTTQLKMLNDNVKSKVDGLYISDKDESTLTLTLTANGVDIASADLPKGGGSSTGPKGIRMRVRAVGATSLVVGEGSDAVVSYDFSSVDLETNSDTGDGTVLITVNGMPVYSGVARQGINSHNIKDSLNMGANVVVVRVTDSYGNYANVRFNVQKASLILTSTFADDLIYTVSPVAFRYTPVGAGEKTVRFWLNDTELAPEKTTASGKQLTKNLTNLRPGANSIKVVAESSIEGAQMKSNELYYEFIYADALVTEPVITISYRKLEVAQFEIIEMPYVVYDPAGTTAPVELLINDMVKQRLSVPRSRQLWSYAAYEQGAFKMEVRCKGVSKSINIQVVPSKYNITEEMGDLRYKVSAIGKSNNSDDRASWAYGDYDAVFKNFLWGADGWQKDKSGDNHLRLIGDSEVEIGIKPFSSNVLLNGLTLTVEYATENVTDANAEIVSCILGGVGIVITPSSVALKSAQSELSVNLDSSTKTSVSFVVQKKSENRLVFLFIDGVMSGTLQYPATDNFSQSTPQGLKMTTGGRSCTAMVYGVRWYENNLNFDQIFGNYVFDMENFDAKIAKYDFNNVTDDYNSIDYNKALEYLPCLTFIGELPAYKGDKKTCDIVYEDRKKPHLSFTATDVQNDVQGTSSQYYPRKNFKFKMRSGMTMSESGEHKDMYSMLGTQIPVNIICAKTDFAESSGTHNTGLAVLIDEALRKLGYKIKPQAQDDRVRTTVFGYPVLIFHKKTQNANAEFIGKYNFNDDKASEQVFGFTPGCESWEFLNNTSGRTLFHSADFSGDDWQNDFEGRYPDGHTDNSNMKKVFEWVVACKGNPAKFKAECDRHFNVDWLLFYCLVTEMFGMVDQRAKNMFLTTYGERGSTGELIWYFIFYDNDTSNGINNEGLISFGFNIESQDPHLDGHVWNGWNSGLWTLVEDAYRDELKALYQRIRQQGVMSAASILEVLQGRQADKWCEAVYNRDGYYKYIEPLLKDNNGAYLYALQGSRTRHRIWWVTNRFRYMDSKYNAGDYRGDYATMRLYTPKVWQGVAPDAGFKIGVTKPGYFHIKYGSYETKPVRGYAGNTYDVKAPNTQFNDTETIIYGISAIRSLGDLSAKYPGTVDITSAAALEDLLIGSLAAGYKNENLTVLHTGANEKLRKINVANCPNLKQSLDLSKCYSLEEVEARGSGATGMSLPASGVLKTANLPASWTSIYLKNQPHLATYTLEGYASVNTVVVDNVPSIDGYELVKQCIAIEGNKLGKVRLTNINAVDASAKTMLALLGMNGEDASGNPTDIAVVTGKLHINSISEVALARIREAMPELAVTYDTLLNVIEFGDDIVKNIAVANFDDNKDGEISANEVEFANIPSGLFAGSGAKRFNEARYWGGAGSRIDNVSTLEELAIRTGKAEINNLPTLKKLSLLLLMKQSARLRL